MKAFVIKNKEGKYLAVSSGDYEHYWTTIDFAHYFRFLNGTHDAKQEAEEFRNTRYPDCEVVEITIAEGDLEQQLAEKDKRIDELEQEREFMLEEVKNRGTCGLCEKLENQEINRLKERIAELEDKDWYEACIKQLEEQNERLINAINKIKAKKRRKVMDIKRIRKELKLNQEQFGALIGVNLQTVSNWEVGKYEPRAKSKREILKICKEVGIKLWM